MFVDGNILDNVGRDKGVRCPFCNVCLSMSFGSADNQTNARERESARWGALQFKLQKTFENHIYLSFRVLAVDVAPMMMFSVFFTTYCIMCLLGRNVGLTDTLDHTV